VAKKIAKRATKPKPTPPKKQANVLKESKIAENTKNNI
jgi:hypothetical protein